MQSKTIKNHINGALGRVFGVQVQLSRYRPYVYPGEVLRDRVGGADWNACIQLEHGLYNPASRVLFIFHDTGLFSCLSVTTWCLSQLISLGHLPASIDFSATLSAYKETRGADVFSELFEPCDVQRLQRELEPYPRSRFVRFDQHGLYKDFDFEILQRLLAAYFRFNPLMVAREAALRKSYLVAGQRYVGVCIRGTDKAVEVAHTDSSVYIEQAERLLDEGAVDRVLIQTDQDQICKLFVAYFRGRCDVIDAVPRTDGTTVLHKTSRIDGQRLEFARNIIAAVKIVSTFDHVITHTGNVGAWIALLRGSARQLWQATPQGLVLP